METPSKHELQRDQKSPNGETYAYEQPYQPPYPTQNQQAPAQIFNGVPPAYQPPYQPLYPTQDQGVPQPIFYGAQPSFVVPQAPTVDFTAAIILSCIVYWFFGGIFGLIAFIFAMVGNSKNSTRDYQGAKTFLKTSYIFSVIGVVVGVILIILIVVFVRRSVVKVENALINSLNKGHNHNSGNYYSGDN